MATHDNAPPPPDWSVPVIHCGDIHEPDARTGRTPDFCTHCGVWLHPVPTA